jgi:hypothetical protein
MLLFFLILAFDHYDEVPAHITQRIVGENDKEKVTSS